MYEIVQFINGEDIRSKEGKTFNSLNPSNEEILASVDQASSYEVDLAVKSAREAFDKGPWPRMSPMERASYLHAFADVFEQKMEEFADLECEDTGMLRSLCFDGHLPRTIEHFRFYAEEAKRMEGRSVPLNSQYINLVHRVPVGVVGIVTPWNGPLSVSSLNMAAALASGNTCIIKPSEQAPISVSLFGQIAQAIGLPKGVLNIVQGPGNPTGKALIDNSGIDAICFIGGTEVGKEVVRSSATNMKRVTLELGGKSPTIILNDANLEEALDGALLSAFSSNGQVCTAGSRIIIEKDIYDSFISRFFKRVENIKVGDPFDSSVEMGPLISRMHLENVEKFISKGIKEGANLLTGGNRPKELEKGFFMRPTVFTEVNNQMEIAREEIFGPVISIIKASNLDEAINIGNDTSYGLAATLYTSDVSKGLQLGNLLNAGSVGINSPVIRDIRNPFGGNKESGLGRVGGRYSIEQFTNLKTITIPLERAPLPRYGLPNNEE